MKRRIFFRALFVLPASLRAVKSDSEWRRVGAPIGEWVWIVFAGGHVGLGKLCRDGVWVQPEGFTMHTVTHWMRLSRPQPPANRLRKKTSVPKL